MKRAPPVAAALLAALASASALGGSPGDRARVPRLLEETVAGVLAATRVAPPPGPAIPACVPSAAAGPSAAAPAAGRLAFAAVNPPSPACSPLRPNVPVRVLPAATLPRALAASCLPPWEFAARVAANLVHDGLEDGSLNPRNPSWRPHLALLLADPRTPPTDAESLFALILAGCAGADDRARVAAAEAWARDHEGGRYAQAVAYSASRHAFAAGDYATAARRCDLLAAAHPAAADRAFLLRALSEAYAGDRARSLRTLDQLRRDHPASPVVPEARFMEAWIALQELRNDDARAIFRDILDTHPRSPSAGKAAEALAALDETD